MPRGSARPLTRGEAELALETFGPSLDGARVRVWSAPLPARLGMRAFVPGGWVWPGRTTIIYPYDEARRDFAAPGTPVWDQSIFVHELTHVWQSQQGVILPWAKLRAGDSAASYTYQLEAGRRWEEFNIEQQAMMVQHRFLLRRGRAAPYPEPVYRALLPFGGPSGREQA